MLVSIRSAKFTKALFEQTQFLDKSNILAGNFSVLGWCIVKSKTNLNLKYIILNDGISGELRKMLFFDFIVEAEGYLELKNPWSTISNQKFEVVDDDLFFGKGKGANKLRNLLEKIKRESEEKGQFYLV